jgi:hypothetical protein
MSFTFVSSNGIGSSCADYNRDRLRQMFREIRMFAKLQGLKLSRGRRRRVFDATIVSFEVDGG